METTQTPNLLPSNSEHPTTPLPSTLVDQATIPCTETQNSSSQSSINPEAIVQNIVANINVAEEEWNVGPTELEEAETEAPPPVIFLPKKSNILQLLEIFILAK